MSIVDAPKVTMQDRSIRLEVPKFKLKYQVKSAAGEEVTIVHFLASLSLQATIDIDSNGVLTLGFNNEPIKDFVIIERSGVVPELTDEGILNMLNEDISAILNDFNMELPLVSGKRAEIKYLGLTGNSGASAGTASNALSIYLGIEQAN